MVKSNEVIRIAIAEASVIVRSGLAMTLKRLPHLKIQPIEILTPTALTDCFRTQMPDILVVNPAFGNFFDISAFRDQYKEKGFHIIALVTSFTDNALLSKYDDFISIFDDLDIINEKIVKLQNLHGESIIGEEQDVLSQREKEIVVCVVKGMTNKEIAEQLFLSIHTVITHRKNISKKLQIHSASGLTIYAIVNKLVELSEIKNL